MAHHTYTHQYAAHYAGQIVTVPDQVAQDQRGYDEARRSFVAIRADGGRVRVRLDGEAYGLHTAGTGDMVCKRA